MSHVDDGELTAYADGAYPVNDPDALRISAHLSTCANCRTRLEQSRELRDRAAQILAYAAPAPRPAPAFEELRAKAGTGGSGVPRNVSLAWAATIFLALGLGWVGRGLWQSPQDPTVASQEATAPERVAAPDAAPVAATTESAPPPASRERGVPSTPAIGTGAQGAAGARAQRTAPASAPTPAPAPAQVADAGEAAVARMESVTVVPAEVAVTAAPPPVAAKAEGVTITSEVRAFAAEAQLTPAEAERRGITYPRIPELEVRSITVGPVVTRVQQLLPDGKIVYVTAFDVAERNSAQIQALLQAAAPQRDPPLQTLAVQSGSRMITVIADLPQDSLRILLEKVR